MRNSVQVPRGFSGVYIVKLLLNLQNWLFTIQRERLLCFLSNYVYQPMTFLLTISVHYKLFFAQSDSRIFWKFEILFHEDSQDTSVCK